MVKFGFFSAVLTFVMFWTSSAIFISGKDLSENYQYKRIMDPDNKNSAHDGLDKRILRMHIRRNSDYPTHIVIRSEPNVGRLKPKTESFEKMWSNPDDSDNGSKHQDGLTNKINFSPFSDNPIKSFISDYNKYLKKRIISNKNEILQSRDLFSESTSDRVRRIYGINDFVTDFLKIISN